MPAKLTKSEIETIERLAREGFNLHQIATETGLSLSTASKYVEAMRAKAKGA